ncbi:MAG: very short patch repair endonuclease [Cereibacter sphaeroides]|uniref:Very short patch repair endonuclease n=1 Tax=Cereibacter sphaeroides TaxID=1063 RepID=A0A2W5S6U1_CERSP|nr:MAG: very short patch repair endonuclease [Cereibacter sphaeroides]
MIDHVAPARRSFIMSQVRQKNTGPELVLRKALHALGYRYRLHRRDLPGSPDIVFPSKRKVIFVHGCFWHGHTCRYGKLPRSRVDYWQQKIETNKERDRLVFTLLNEAGWVAFVVWQCELRELEGILASVTEFLDR